MSFTKHALAIVFVFLCTYGVARSQNTSVPVPSRQMEQEVLKAESDLSVLMTKPDRQGFDRLLSGDFLQNNQNGALVDKPGYVENFFNGTIQLETYVTSAVRVRIYGDTAIVNGIETVSGNRTGRRRFSRTYVKNGGAWRLVNNHITTM